MNPSNFPPIVIDTREQLPYVFAGFRTERAKLDAGDYSLAGLQSRVSVERKSVGDAYGCVGGGRKRFVRHLQLLAQLASPAIVIEASLDVFAQGHPRTRITGAQAVVSFISWSEEYRIPVFWCPNREYAERVTLKWLAAYLRHLKADKK